MENWFSAHAPYSSQPGTRRVANAPACWETPRPVCGREAARRTRMQRWLRLLLCPHSPQVPAPGSHLRNRRLDWFRRPEISPQLERRVNCSLKRAPKRNNPSILWACACGSETGGWRPSAVFFPRRRRPVLARATS